MRGPQKGDVGQVANLIEDYYSAQGDANSERLLPTSLMLLSCLSALGLGTLTLSGSLPRLLLLFSIPARICQLSLVPGFYGNERVIKTCGRILH